MKSSSKLLIASLILNACHSAPVSKSQEEAAHAIARTQLYSCTTQNPEATLSLTLRSGVQGVGSLDNVDQGYFISREQGYGELTKVDDVAGVPVLPGMALRYLKDWGDGDTDFFYAQMPQEISSQSFSMTIVEKSDEIGHLVNTDYVCEEAVNAPITETVSAGSFLECQGDVTSTGDNADIATIWLSETQLGKSLVGISTEYAIDDPAAYIMPAVAADNSKLIQMQLEGKIGSYYDLEGEERNVDFSQYNCFDFSKETNASSQVYLCLPKNIEGKIIEEVQPIVIDDIVNGDGYTSSVVGSCYNNID